MILSRKTVLITLSIICSSLAWSSDTLIKENHKVYFKSNNSKIFLFEDPNYCFDKDVFSIEHLTNDERKYLVVNHTEDCNPSGEHKIFEIVDKKAVNFYLSSLYDPEFFPAEGKIVERFKDGAIRYTKIYTLKNNRYHLSEEIKTLDENINLSAMFDNRIKKFQLKDNSNKKIKSFNVSVDRLYLYNDNFKKKKSYFIKGDVLILHEIIEIKKDLYIKVSYKGNDKIGYVLLTDLI